MFMWSGSKIPHKKFQEVGMRRPGAGPPNKQSPKLRCRWRIKCLFKIAVTSYCTRKKRVKCCSLSHDAGKELSRNLREPGIGKRHILPAHVASTTNTSKCLFRPT
jgi:hypothetical protein